MHKGRGADALYLPSQGCNPFVSTTHILCTSSLLEAAPEPKRRIASSELTLESLSQSPRFEDGTLTVCCRERELWFHTNKQHLPRSRLYLQILGTNHHLDSPRLLHLLGRRAKKPIGAETPVQVRLDSTANSLDIRIHCLISRAIPMRQTSAQSVEAFQTRLEQLSEVVERFLGAHSPTAASCDKVVSHVLGLGAESVNH